MSTTQSGIHRRLAQLIRFQQRAHWEPRPLQLSATQKTRLTNDRRPRILDACCGNGESTYLLAERYPEHLVIGFDKSAARLSPVLESEHQPDNVFFLLADAPSVWRHARLAQWVIAHQFLLYPNPWPKPRHVQKRWYAHPAFRDVLANGGVFELRTNWRLYAEECRHCLHANGVRQVRLELLNGAAAIEAEAGLEKPSVQAKPISPFERKYRASGHQLYRLRATLNVPRGESGTCTALK